MSLPLPTRTPHSRHCLGPGCQQPHTAPSPASAAHDSEILPDSGDNIPATARPFLPPRSVPRPAQQTSTTNIQNSESGHVNLAANANDVDSLDQQADDHIFYSSAQRCKRHKTTEFWTFKIIDSDGTIKPARLSVREAIERPNARKIVLRFNRAKQAIGDKAGLLSGVLGLLGTDYGKFLIYIKGTIKKNILKSMEKSWKEGRLRLYDTFYEPKFTTVENIEQRPPGIDREHWRWFLNYRTEEEIKVFGKEKPGRVRGMGAGPTPSQLFGPNSRAPVNGVQVEETQRKLLELQAELEYEKLKRKAMEDALIYLYQRQGEELPPDIAAGMSFVE
ncbi:hypothetical protein Ahy_B01g053873 [Arachis hypogaea]|uniref:Uncharacterized protein n=1 Tax=Arachis hypogaea TaxID=3818 RepID=A0A445AST1_ARAHY|nr:hypothetical protein Ahy_B01g053873 [Arachis hypogaea]